MSGTKRVIEETGDELEVRNHERSDFVSGDCGKRKIRVLEGIDGEVRACKGIEDRENEEIEIGSVVGNLLSGRLETREKAVEETEKSDAVRELESSSDGVKEEEKLGLDLNVTILDEEEFGGSTRGVRGNGKAEIIDISSDDDENEDERNNLVSYDTKGKGMENAVSHRSNLGLDLDLGKMEVGPATGESSSIGGGRRYTREEKGKAKVEQPWISLGTDAFELNLTPDDEEQMQAAVSAFNLEFPEILWQHDLEALKEAQELRREEEIRLLRVGEERRQREEQWAINRQRFLQEQRQRDAEDRVRTHRRLARPLEDDGNIQSPEKEKKVPPSAGIDLGSKKSTDPFSSVLNMIRERNSKQKIEQLIRWEPSRDRNVLPFIPSLRDLSLKLLADNAEAIVSLEAVPDALKQRLSNLLCDSRKMNAKILDLFVRGSPTEIRVKDCSWITEDQFTKSFGSFDPSNLRVFQLDLCGQCVLDDIISKTLARSSDILPGLGVISLRGACRLSDDALKVLVKLAPALSSINLGQCSLLTDVGISDLANALGSCLKELFIDYCNRIDAKRVAPALKKFEHLEVLSVAGISTVSDEFITDIITACGKNLKDFDLADCNCLTDSSLKVIGQICSELRALNIANLHKLTDLGLLYLANGCRSIRRLKLCRNDFSDEAIAAFVEVSGESLNELSLNHVTKVGFNAALSLAKCSRNLVSLDLSWCRRVTNEVLGSIVDSCLSLKLLKLFGCTQITDVFLNGHANSSVRIIGLNLTSVLEHMGMLETEEVLLRYSSLPIPSESRSGDRQGV